LSGKLSRISQVSWLARIRLVVTALFLLAVLIYLPVRGDYSFATGGGIVGAVGLLYALTLRPEIFRGSEFFLALVAGVIAYTAVPQRVDELGFYGATAQVVPILFLALAVETGVLAPGRQRDEPERRVAVLIAAGLVFAGYASLRALATGTPQVG
jgi:hypothetical protein